MPRWGFPDRRKFTALAQNTLPLPEEAASSNSSSLQSSVLQSGVPGPGRPAGPPRHSCPRQQHSGPDWECKCRAEFRHLPPTEAHPCRSCRPVGSAAPSRGAKVSALLRIIRDTLSGDAGAKFVVFCKDSSGLVIRHLGAVLGQEGIGHAAIHNGIKASERSEALSSFTGDPDVKVCLFSSLLFSSFSLRLSLFSETLSLSLRPLFSSPSHSSCFLLSVSSFYVCLELTLLLSVPPDA